MRVFIILYMVTFGLASLARPVKFDVNYLNQFYLKDVPRYNEGHSAKLNSFVGDIFVKLYQNGLLKASDFVDVEKYAGLTKPYDIILAIIPKFQSDARIVLRELDSKKHFKSSENGFLNKNMKYEQVPGWDWTLKAIDVIADMCVVGGKLVEICDENVRTVDIAIFRDGESLYALDKYVEYWTSYKAFLSSYQGSVYVVRNWWEANTSLLLSILMNLRDLGVIDPQSPWLEVPEDPFNPPHPVIKFKRAFLGSKDPDTDNTTDKIILNETHLSAKLVHDLLAAVGVDNPDEYQYQIDLITMKKMKIYGREYNAFPTHPNGHYHNELVTVVESDPEDQRNVAHIRLLTYDNYFQQLVGCPVPRVPFDLSQLSNFYIKAVPRYDIGESANINSFAGDFMVKLYENGLIREGDVSNALKLGKMSDPLEIVESIAATFRTNVNIVIRELNADTHFKRFSGAILKRKGKYVQESGWNWKMNTIAPLKTICVKNLEIKGELCPEIKRTVNIEILRDGDLLYALDHYNDYWPSFAKWVESSDRQASVKDVWARGKTCLINSILANLRDLGVIGSDHPWLNHPDDLPKGDVHPVINFKTKTLGIESGNLLDAMEFFFVNDGLKQLLIALNVNDLTVADFDVYMVHMQQFQLHNQWYNTYLRKPNGDYENDPVAVITGNSENPKNIFLFNYGNHFQQLIVK